MIKEKILKFNEIDDYFDCDEEISDSKFLIYYMPLLIPMVILDVIFKTDKYEHMLFRMARHKTICPFSVGNYAHAFAETWEWKSEFNRWNNFK